MGRSTVNVSSSHAVVAGGAGQMVLARRCCGWLPQHQVACPSGTNLSQCDWLLEQHAAHAGSSKQICHLLPAGEPCGPGAPRGPESCNVPKLPDAGGHHGCLPSQHVPCPLGISVFLWLCCQGGSASGEHATQYTRHQGVTGLVVAHCMAGWSSSTASFVFAVSIA